MMASNAAGVEILRKHTEWLRAFGPGSVVQEPSLGVAAYNIPVSSMKLAPETMSDVAAELLAQKNWGEVAKVQYLGLLTRLGARAEGSILIRVHQPSHSQPRDHQRCSMGKTNTPRCAIPQRKTDKVMQKMPKTGAYSVTLFQRLQMWPLRR